MDTTIPLSNYSYPPSHDHCIASGLVQSYTIGEVTHYRCPCSTPPPQSLVSYVPIYYPVPVQICCHSQTENTTFLTEEPVDNTCQCDECKGTVSVPGSLEDTQSSQSEVYSNVDEISRDDNGPRSDNLTEEPIEEEDPSDETVKKPKRKRKRKKKKTFKTEEIKNPEIQSEPHPETNPEPMIVEDISLSLSSPSPGNSKKVIPSKVSKKKTSRKSDKKNIDLELDKWIEIANKEREEEDISKDMHNLYLAHSMVIGVAMTLLAKIGCRYYLEYFFRRVQKFLGLQDEEEIRFGYVMVQTQSFEDMDTNLSDIKKAYELIHTFWMDTKFCNVTGGGILDLSHEYCHQVIICCELIRKFLEQLLHTRNLTLKQLTGILVNTKPREAWANDFCKKYKVVPIPHPTGNPHRVLWPEEGTYHPPASYFKIMSVIWGMRDGKCLRCLKQVVKTLVTSCCYSEQVICDCMMNTEMIFKCLNTSEECHGKVLNMDDFCGKEEQENLREIKKSITESLIIDKQKSSLSNKNLVIIHDGTIVLLDKEEQ